MTDHELNQEFIAQLESIEMPSYLKDAIVGTFHACMEGFSASYSGTGNVKNVRMPTDGMEKAILDKANEIRERSKMMSGEDMTPAQFAKLVEQIRRNPRKYLNNRAPLATDIEEVESTPEIREAAYKAVLAFIDTMYRHFGLTSFDTEANLHTIMYDDNKRPTHGPINPNPVMIKKFSDLRANPTVNTLLRENYGLREVVGSATTFLRKLNEAGDKDNFLDFAKSRWRTNIKSQAHEGKVSLSDANEEFIEKQKREKIEQARAESTAPTCIVDVMKKMKKAPYEEVYNQFVSVALPGDAEVAPKPGEDIFHYMSRLDEPNDCPNFPQKLNASVMAVYGADGIAKLQNLLSQASDFQYAYSKGENEDNSLVPASCKEVFLYWLMFQKYNEMSTQMGGRRAFSA